MQRNNILMFYMAVMLIFIGSSSNAQIPFKTQYIAGEGAVALNPALIRVADFDNDNDMDILSTSMTLDKIIWYENNGEQLFRPHLVSDQIDGPNDVFLIDLDRDNDICLS